MRGPHTEAPVFALRAAPAGAELSSRAPLFGSIGSPISTVAGGGTMQWKALGASVAVLAIGIAGCGSSSHGSSSNALSASRFRAQANSVCRLMHAQINEIGRVKRVNGMRGEVQEIAVIAGQALQRLDAITAPKELAHDYGDFKTHLRIQREYIVHALATPPQTVPHSVQAAEQERTTELAHGLGLSDCT